LRRSITGSIDDPDGLGARLAAVLLEDGAAELAPGLSETLPTATGTAGPARLLDQMSHPSVTPGTQGIEGGNVPTNPSSTTTERVS
jgi:hypothetical protein